MKPLSPKANRQMMAATTNPTYKNIIECKSVTRDVCCIVTTEKIDDAQNIGKEIK